MSTEPAPQETVPAPRVQLNPTVDPDQARPVPSFYSPPPGATPGKSVEAEPVPDAAPVVEPDKGPSATRVAPREKVEIPAGGAPLDSTLEAEIDAALSSAGSLALGDMPEEGVAQTAPQP